MNPINRKHNVTALLALAGLSACSVALAQPAAKPCLKPKAETTFTITFEGPDAGEVSDVVAYVNRQPTARTPGQEFFAQQYSSNGTTAVRVSPGVFHVKVV